MFKNKKLLITGGTGSFGNTVTKRFLSTDIDEIRIFSRDEKKQDDMRKLHKNDKLKFYLGDVRDYDACFDVVQGVDYVFHAAALKQVPSCEFFPMQAVKTNIIGTENLLSACVAAQVSRVVCLSTDKAVYPINSMGMSKALMEKIAQAKARTSSRTVISVTRYGNVMASRGSVIPMFVDQILKKQPITVTDPNMTRFMMTLDDAVELVLFAFEKASSGDIFVQKAPAATVEILAKAVCSRLGADGHEISTIGARHGEKLFEVLLSREEMSAAQDLGKYYKIPADTRDLNYGKFVEAGSRDLAHLNEYSSHNTHRLTLDEMKGLLDKIDLSVDGSGVY